MIKSIYFIKSGESAVAYSWKYSLISFFAGWWGIPFGPIFSIASFAIFWNNTTLKSSSGSRQSIR
jgi:hypothetical protein